MPFTPKFAKNNASAILILDNTSSLTIDITGYTLPTDVTSGKFLISIDEEILLVNSISDNTSSYELDVDRAQEGTFQTIHDTSSEVKLYMTAGLYNELANQIVVNTDKLDLIDITSSINLNYLDVTSSVDLNKLNLIDVSSSVDLNDMYNDIQTNNAKVSNATHTGDVGGAITLTIQPSAISGKTEITPIEGDFLLVWDASDSTIRKANVSNFLGGGGGDTSSGVFGPEISTNSAIVLFDGTGGTYLKDSSIIVDSSSNISGINNISLSGTVDGRDIASDGSKLDGIETGATADQTDEEIETAYNNRVLVVDQTTAESGTSTTVYRWTPERVKQTVLANTIEPNYPVTSVNDQSGIVVLSSDDIDDSGATNKYITQIDLDKLSNIDVTSSVDLNSMYDDIIVNNAKVSNATHSGDITGSTSITITPTAISGKTEVTAASGDFVLLWDSTDSALKKANVSDFFGDISGGTGLPTSTTTGGLLISDGSGGWGEDDRNVLITNNLDVSGTLNIAKQIRYTNQENLDTSGSVTWNIEENPVANIGPLTSNITLTIEGIQLNGEASLHVFQNDSTSYEITWPGIVNWIGVNEPDISDISGEFFISFFSYDGTGLLASYINPNDSLELTNAEIETAYNNQVDVVDQSTAETGTSTTVFRWTPERVKQAIDANVVNNATHTGEVTGSTTLTLDPTSISNKTQVTPVSGDFVLLWDATDSTLKKANMSDILSDSSGSGLPTSTTTGGLLIADGSGGWGEDDRDVTISNRLIVDKQIKNSTQTELTTTGSFTWNIEENPSAKIEITGNITLTISGISINANASLYFVQNASTAYDITWPETVIWAGGLEPDLSTLSSKHIINFFSYDGTGLFGAYISNDTSTGGSGLPTSTTTGGLLIADGSGGWSEDDRNILITNNLDISGGITVSGQTRHSSQTTLTSSGSVTWDIDANPKAKLEITGNVTSLTISNININSEATLYFIQDNSTAYTIEWPATVNWVGDTAPNLSELGSEFIISFYSYDGTNLIGTYISTLARGEFVEGPATATDNAIAVFDSSSGSLLKNSTVLIDVSGNMSGLNSLDISGDVTLSGSIEGRKKPTISTLTSGASVSWSSTSADIFKLIVGHTAQITADGAGASAFEGEIKQFFITANGTNTVTLDTTSTNYAFKYSADITGYTISDTSGLTDSLLVQFLNNKWNVMAINQGI